MAAALLPAAGLGLSAPQAAGKEGSEPKVTATEDLMREHGIMRRTLLVYTEILPQLRTAPAKLDAAPIHKAADLFRTFGEQYHEKLCEEEHIFPTVRKMKSPISQYPDLLVAQHLRGREITGFILSASNGAHIATANAEPLARALESTVRMYQNHAAREDTIVFPAWKLNFTNKQLDEIAEEFEALEHKMFGKAGFDDAEAAISKIEATLGLADLAQFTAPPPPTLS